TYVFGGEQTSGGATWKAAEDTAATGVLPSTNTRLRFSLQNSGTAQTNSYRLQVADKAAALNCESVPYVNYNDVPPSNSGLCSSAVACMASSTQFTLFDPTSPHMSYPATMNFTAGEILQGYANETHSFSLPGNTETEVEYNFQVTNNATQSSYCFRTTNGGLDLANYDHMAEVTVVHPPFITNINLNNSQNIALTEGATTTVYAT